MKKFMGKTKSSAPQAKGGSKLDSVPAQKLERPPSLLSLDAYSPPPSAESYSQNYTEAIENRFPFSEDEDDTNDDLEDLPYPQSKQRYNIPPAPPIPKSKAIRKKGSYKQKPRDSGPTDGSGPEMEDMQRLKDPERPSKLIHQTDLVLAKRMLRKKGQRLKPLSFDRQDLFDSFEINDYFPILYCKTFLMTQISTGDIVSLNFSGVDQLTDAFFYTLMAGNINLPHLKNLLCTGCVHLTDLSMKWIVKMFPNLVLVNFNGCVNLSEKSLHQLWTSPTPPGDILMMGTNVGVDMLNPVGENLSVSCKLSGCPIVSHSGPGAKGDAPMNSHKAVILLDKRLMLSVGRQLTGVSGGLDGERGVSYWPDWHVDKCSYSFNLFEVCHDECVADLVLSDGCVVLLPYPASGVATETIVSSLFTRMMKIACKYPDSVCVITSIENSTEKNQSEDISHSEVRKQLEEKIQMLSKDMSKEIAKIFKWKWIVDSFIFPTQIYFGQWVKQSETLDNLQFLQHPTPHSGSLKIIRKSSSPPIGQALQEAVSRIEAAQPYYKTISQDLSAILTAVKDCHLQSLTSAYNLIPGNVCRNLHPQNALPHVEKGLQILHLRGILMFIGWKESSLVAGDVSYLLKGVNQLLNSTAATSSLPCLEPNMTCWNRQDLTDTLGAKGFSTNETRDLLSILENSGCLLPVSVEGEKEEVSDTTVYVCIDALPDQPPKQLAGLWPTPIPDSEIQVEKMYTFTLELPSSLLTSYFRHCNKISEFCVLWKRGVFINQGPVDVLLQQDWNDQGMPVIAVCCRTFRPTGNVGAVEYTNKCLWSTLNIYTRILDYVINRYDVFAKITVPCPTCVPSKDLQLQLKADSCHQFHVVTFTSGIHCSREGPTSTPFNSVDLLGPMRPSDSLVPRHADWYLELTKSRYVHSYKCYQCSRISRDGAGQKKPLCPNCGTCSRCVEFVAEVEKTLMPGFSSCRGGKGSTLTTNLADSLLPVKHGMQPGLFSEMHVTLIRGNSLTIMLKLLKSDTILKYEIAIGSVTMVTGTGKGQLEQDVSWQGSEGDSVSIRVSEGEISTNLEIKCYLNGFMIWRRSVEKQCIMPQFASSKDSLGFVLQTPGIKAYWQTQTALDRLNERMCLEFSESEDTIVSARVTGNNGKVVTLITDHMSKVTLENAKTVELTSDKLHPVGYAKFKGRPLNGKTGVGAYAYTLPYGASFAPLWLFNEAQRGGCTGLESGGTTPPTMPCLYFPTPAAIQCKMNQMIPLLKTALYQNGGIDFTGSAMTLLPGNKSKDVFQWPARHLLGNQQNLQCHPLCYIRAECEDMLVLHPAKQDLEDRNLYWQLHFLNAPGFPMPENFTTDHSYLPLLWAWHVLQASQEMRLPEKIDQFCSGSASQLSISQVELAVHQYIRWQSCQLALILGPFVGQVFFQDVNELTQAAKVLRAETKKNLATSGLQEFITLLSEDTIYLCSAHISCQQIDMGLEEFPSADFTCYKHFITSMKIEGNKLEYLPENFFIEFPSLLDLQLVHNDLFCLPSGVGNCKSLCHLKVRDNLLQTLPEDLSECPKLRLLELSGNPMDNIPAVVTQIKSLERLYISFMQLHKLPEDIGNLTKLVVLNASGNCLSTLPPSFSNLKNLTQLYLNGIPWMPLKQNTLLSREHFDKFLEKHAHLLDWLEDHDHDKALLYEQFDEDQNGTLDVSEVAKLNATLFHIFPRFGHQGKDVPDEESYSGFPEEILGLEKLEYLSLQYQGLVTLPETIKTLSKLNKINLAHNPFLTTVAAAAGELPLKMLELEDCPSLKTPPKEIRARGFSSTYAYLRRLLTGSVDCHRTKLMFVGLGGAGKTSLSRALLSGNLRTEANAFEAITDGIDISTWTVKSKDDHISYSVWDFAGQTVYYNTHQFFLSDRAVYLLLWNIRLGHEHAGLDFWLSSISVHAPKAPIFVVGTHLDKVSKTEIPMAEMKQKYPQIAGFHFVSSYTGKGVAELQQHMFDVTLQQPYMGEKIPGVWLNFEKKIMANQHKESVVEYKDIETMASEAGIFDQSEVSQAVQFLHDLGSLQHFNNEFLKSYVVINPQWIVDVMTCVVSVKDSPIQEGRFHHKDIGQVWKDYPPELHQWLLRLTEEFDLTFPMADQQLNLVPCLLPEVQPQIDWPELDKNSSERETKMIYKFTYLPAGLFNRGQVRLYQFSDSSVIWKRGSLLRKNGHQALLQQTRKSELVVKVQGPRPENILFLIHEVFEGLIGESFQGVTYNFLIPCPDCLKSATREPHMFAASTVRRASELKAPFLQCMKYFHTISVIDLLANMPPDNNTDYDIHLVSAVRGLKDLKKDLSADLFISYSPQNISESVSPDKVHSDLIGAGYKCWYPKGGRLKNVDQMAKALMDCQVFVALISNEYVLDKTCCDIFKYARLILKKPVILVVVGKGFEWRQSKLGILLADDLFVNMQKMEHYQDKLKELLGLIRERTHSENKDVEHPPCFISYSWQNSAVAVAKGTRHTSGALGFGDPRGVKDYLEENGVKCWIDVERVGVNGLFEDIAEGLLNAKIMVACVSDEYAMSPNCQFEFRFAANTLKLPIVLAVMGTGNAWRAKEVGFLSIEYPIVSFQEKSESAHQKLLTLVRDRLNMNLGEGDAEVKKKKKNEINESHKNMSFQELYELAQRKFLRQVAHYAAKQEALYPRLFVADFAPQDKDGDRSEENAKELTTDDSGERRPLVSKSSKVSIDIQDEDKHDFHNKKYCFYILCEHEEGWHSCSSPLKAPDWFGQSKLEKYSPYLARITTILRYNRQLMLNCMAGQDGDKYLHWLEQNPQALESDFQSTYQDLRQEVINADQTQAMGNLARCHLPNGKTIWLCEEHQKASRVSVLSNEFVGMTTGSTETTTENLMLDHLSQLDSQAVMRQFGSSEKRTRKSVQKKHAERKKRPPKPQKISKPPSPALMHRELKPPSPVVTERPETTNHTVTTLEPTNHTVTGTPEERRECAQQNKSKKQERYSEGDNLATLRENEASAADTTPQPSGNTDPASQYESAAQNLLVEQSRNLIVESQLQKMRSQLNQVESAGSGQRRHTTSTGKVSAQKSDASRNPESRTQSRDHVPRDVQSAGNTRRANKSSACTIS